MRFLAGIVIPALAAVRAAVTERADVIRARFEDAGNEYFAAVRARRK